MFEGWLTGKTNNFRPSKNPQRNLHPLYCLHFFYCETSNPEASWNTNILWHLTQLTVKSSWGSHLLTVAYLVLQDCVMLLRWDGPGQSQAALRGVTLPNHRHQWWYCADDRRHLNTAGCSDYLEVSPSSSPALTVMGGSDVDAAAGRFLATELRYPT